MMRKVVLLLAVVLAIGCAALLLHNNSQAAITYYKATNGHAYRAGDYLLNYPIQARADGSTTWVDVATSDPDNGSYYWAPNQGPGYWPAGYIYMRVKPLCDSELANKADPSDSTRWSYLSSSNYITTTDVHSNTCP